MPSLNIAGALGFSGFRIFNSLFLTVLLVIIIVVVFLILVIAGIVLWINAKKYRYRIPLYTKVGNVPTRIAVLKAKPVAFGRAGDQLWFVKGKGVKKWIPPASVQSAKNEFWHWIREDGEWVNFSIDDLDEIAQKAGVKYVKQESRLTRLAIDKLLEQRFQNKGFWEKWGVVIGYVIFFLVITIAIVIFLHQYGKIIQTTGQVLEKADSIIKDINQIKQQGQGGEGISGLIPADAAVSLVAFVLGRKHGSSMD